MSDSNQSSPLPWYARILVNYQHLTLALLVGVCFGLAVSLIALDSSRDSAATALAAEHASDIARLGADQSSQPLFNNDLISLQVLLTSLVQLDQVQGLTVHDVENRLMAQAGNVAASGGIYRTALITQNDNVAGYLTVIAHRPGNTSSRNLWFAIFALAMGALLLLLLKRQLPMLNQPVEDGEGEEDDTTEEEELTFTPSNRAPGPNCVALTLVSERINQVAKQLNAATFNRVLDELNRHISSVKSLYGAQLITAGHTLPILLFDGNDREQNTVNALCSAQLLLALSYRMKTPLALHAQVEQYQRDGKLTDCPERFQASNKTLFLGIAAPLAEAVSDRFRFREDNGYWLETEEFGDTYQSLLDNQLKQLLRTSGYDIDTDDGSAYREKYEEQLAQATQEQQEHFDLDEDELAASELLPAGKFDEPSDDYAAEEYEAEDYDEEYDTDDYDSDSYDSEDDDSEEYETEGYDSDEYDPESYDAEDSDTVQFDGDSAYREPDLDPDWEPSREQDSNSAGLALTPDPSLQFATEADTLEPFASPHYDDLDEISQLAPEEDFAAPAQPHQEQQPPADIEDGQWSDDPSDNDDDMAFEPDPEFGLTDDDLDALDTDDGQGTETSQSEDKPWPRSSLFEKAPSTEGDDQDSEAPPAKGEHIKPYQD
ncbi:hypothetical protein [Halioxenophilus aromaticivorans]|uniref:Uncharacterized protein n=1 Tax=Halioxenophilus aromaticivorans TaxID=1306992 RepID=A0AAV3U2D4_9ALTE